jgi:hypothetical protein
MQANASHSLLLVSSLNGRREDGFALVTAASFA